MTADSDDFLTSQYRKEYQEDAFRWLFGRFSWVNERIIKENDWLATQAKEFVQHAAESLLRTRMQTRDSLVLWVGLIAVVALASAGLWIGVGSVALIVLWVWRRSLRTAKALYCFDRFRNDCFRKLLGVAEGEGRWSDGSKEMLEEDKDFVRKCRDSILFPLAVAPGRRKTLSSIYDLEKIETLYREYCHTHSCGPYGTECDLCAARRRVQEHVEDVLSQFETQIGVALMGLFARIDGRDSDTVIQAASFLEKYREWQKWRWLQDSESESSKKLLETLRDKESWTFEEADQVRELCRTEKTENRLSDFGDRASQLFDLLTGEMEAAAKRCGVEERWQFYNTNRNWLVEGSGSFIRMEDALKYIRRAFKRHNPETTVRELLYPDGSFSRADFEQLQPLKEHYGFDLELVKRQLTTAWKVVQEERRERKEELQMFSTAWSFFELEQAENKRRRAAAHRE